MILILFDNIQEKLVRQAPKAEQRPIDIIKKEERKREDKDSVTITSNIKTNSEKGDGKFTIGSAMGKFCKGFFSPLTAFYHHPVIACGLLGAGIVGCSLFPALVPVLTIGFGIYSVYQIGKGLVKTTARLIKGDYDGAENAFEDIGAGTSGLLL